MRSILNHIILIAFSGMQLQVPHGPKPRFILTLPDKPAPVIQIHSITGGRCSAFYVAPQVIITAAHCTDSGAPFTEDGQSTNILYEGHSGQVDDYAILWVQKPSAEWLDPTEELPPHMGPLLDIVKNPDLAAHPLSYVADAPDGSYIVMGRVRPGDSGSPVLDLDNKVIGIAFAYNAATGEFAFVAPIPQVIKKLKELKLEIPSFKNVKSPWHQ